MQIIQNKCSRIISNNNFYNGKDQYVDTDTCHKHANLEYLEQFINRLAQKFFNHQVDKIYILKNQGQNIVNSAWEKRSYPYQKFHSLIDQ